MENLTNPAVFEEWLNKVSKEGLIEWSMEFSILKKEVRCPLCNAFMKLRPFKRNKDGIAWRCFTSDCPNYLNYFGIRTSFF